MIQEYINCYKINNSKIDLQFYMLILYYKKKIHIYYYNNAIIRKLQDNNTILYHNCIKNLENYYEILFHSQYLLTLLSNNVIDYIKPIKNNKYLLQYHLLSPIILLSKTMKPYLININTKPDYITIYDTEDTIKLKKNVMEQIIQLYHNIDNRKPLFHNIKNMNCIM